jgi:polyhydroxyalkanoate synthesis regulator phasin
VAVILWFRLSLAIKVSRLMNRTIELLNLIAVVGFMSLGFAYQHFLNMTAALLESMVDQGKMSRIKARALEQEIERFNNIQSWPEQLKSIKITMMREIVKGLKTAFSEELCL